MCYVNAWKNIIAIYSLVLRRGFLIGCVILVIEIHRRWITCNTDEAKHKVILDNGYSCLYTLVNFKSICYHFKNTCSLERKIIYTWFLKLETWVVKYSSPRIIVTLGNHVASSQTDLPPTHPPTYPFWDMVVLVLKISQFFDDFWVQNRQ